MTIYNTHIRKRWIILMVVLALISGFCVGKIFAMGKSPLMENRLQLAEQMNLKLAEKVTGIEQANIKLADKLDGQIAAQVGMNNQISKVSSEMKLNGNNNLVNDSKVMTDYIQSMKDSHKEVVESNWHIIKLLILELVGIISAFGFYMYKTISFLLSADERRDIREEKREAK